MIARELKYRVDVAGQRFIWQADRPLSAAVELVVAHPDLGDITVPLTIVATEGEVTAIADDRRTLTLAAPVASSAGLQGTRWGVGFLVTDEDAAFPVVIKRLSGTTVVLADALPSDIALAQSGRLIWATHTAELPVGTVLSAAHRDLTWRVSYTAADGDDTPTEALRALGLMHVVAQPFDTGLTTQTLVGLFPRICKPIPRGQEGWEPQIQAAEAMLIEMIRATLLPADKWEDDIPASQRLQVAHAHLTASLILLEQDIDRAETMRERAEKLANDVLRRVWVDQDGDLDPTDGGDDEHLGGVPRETRGSAFYGTATSRTFTSDRWW